MFDSPSNLSKLTPPSLSQSLVSGSYVFLYPSVCSNGKYLHEVSSPLFPHLSHLTPATAHLQIMQHSCDTACCSLFAQLTADTTHDPLVHHFADRLHPLPFCDAVCIRIFEHGETRLRCTIICTGSISRVRSAYRSCGSRERAGCTSRSSPRRGILLKAMFAPVSTPLPSFHYRSRSKNRPKNLTPAEVRVHKVVGDTLAIPSAPRISGTSLSLP